MATNEQVREESQADISLATITPRTRSRPLLLRHRRTRHDPDEDHLGPVAWSCTDDLTEPLRTEGCVGAIAIDDGQPLVEPLLQGCIVLGNQLRLVLEGEGVADRDRRLTAPRAQQHDRECAGDTTGEPPDRVRPRHVVLPSMVVARPPSPS